MFSGPEEVSLAGRYRSDLAAGTLTYSVTVEGETVETRIEGATVRIYPLAAGTSVVTVTARGVSSGEVSDAFTVEVLDRAVCNTTGFVRLAEPLVDTAVFIGDPAERVALPNHFSADPEAGDLSFTVNVTGPSASAEVQGLNVLIQPLALGSSNVAVVARGAEGGVASDTFAVTITETCPIEYGALAYFPFVDGETVRFDYTEYYRGDARDYRIIGDLVWNVNLNSCKSYVIEEQLTGSRVQVYPDGSTSQPSESNRSRTIRAVFGANTLMLDGYRGLNPFAVPATQEDEVSVEESEYFGFGTGYSLSYTIRRSFGLVEWRHNDYSRHYSRTATLTRK